MGKRKKSSRKPAPKIKRKLSTTFSCLFCNHADSIICTIDKKTNIGSLNCKICGQTFQTPIHTLSQPVDIYADWVDACEEIAEETNDMNYNNSDDNLSNNLDKNYSIDHDNDRSSDIGKNTKPGRFDDLSEIDESDGDYVDE
ncbi:Elf1p [Ascoidea rubescens DSM 1968]|uniref:Transcription elongation factor 1 homolog n=1 Tax=Ascoidea rubescens DSM 1968 TaxID=1344418 RepID=A0A1D2VK95_9ASCO|nr:Elf1-domain-containing protein [Ascoidea rubescens DSM 1968]ODV62034.1 Elf1-domain-containing protein [Ascoidea rubescens DSM 1968]